MLLGFKPVNVTYDTTAANTRLHEFEKCLKAIEKAKSADTAALGNKRGQDVGTMK